ncbi:hypothetical protein GGH93_001240 [Coemansia aciculifera]|nr:hypothetical protein GGH93_001240 [Coemansia aciculifera]
MVELPAYMVPTYARWVNDSDAGMSDTTGNIECMSLLALICPNFDYVAIDQRKREPSMKSFEESIDLARYRSYAPHLRRLLFNVWQNCLAKLTPAVGNTVCPTSNSRIF